MEFRRLWGDFKRQSIKVATFLKTREVVTFLFFLLLAFGLWYMHSSGTQRQLRDTLHVKYIGIPGNVSFEQPLPTEVTFVVKDEGRQLWQYSSTVFDTVMIDLSSQFASGSRIEIEFEKQLQKILLQLSPTAKMVELSPGYFVTDYVRLDSKEVPVRLSGELKLAPQHVLINDVSLTPNRITMYGRKSDLDTIDCVYLEPVEEVLSDSKVMDLNVLHIDNVSLSHDRVFVNIPVDMYTEKEVYVPIVNKNVPQGYIVRTFPSVVTIRFSVALSRYNSVRPNDFKVVFDYNNALIEGNDGTEMLELIGQPNSVFNVQVNPDEVEYVIEREY